MLSDAAALPSPPTEPPWKNGSRSPNHNHMRPAGARMPRALGAFGNDGHGFPAGFGGPRFPNIKDLQDQAASLELHENTSLDVLLQIAKQAIERARGSVDEDQLDRAYVEYLRASEITINIIPHHHDYRDTVHQRPDWYKQFADLMMAVRMKQGTMGDVKKQILEDNIANNVQPRGFISRNSTPELAARGPYDSYAMQGSGVIRMPSPTGYRNTSISQTPSSRDTSNMEDSLAQRFARLKATPSRPTSDTGMLASGRSSNTSTPPSESSTDDYSRRHWSHQAQGRYSSFLSSPQRRPLGPRSMGSSHNLPALPPKIPLDTSLPRAPDPTYSPIWTVPSQSPPNPPRTSTESARALNIKSSLAVSPESSPNRASPSESPYRARTPNGSQATKESKNSSNDLPHDNAISVQQLVDYLQRFNVLLIDVRTRDEYDMGHIHAKSVICIEPVALKENVSAEELEERLVVSPEREQSLFERRNEFDMVVYYDRNTNSVSYLAGSPVGTSAPHLRALHDTLYEFNAYKPLKDGRPPALLIGGLDAWIDVLGSQSLATSSTAAVMGSIQANKPVRKAGRPLGRVPTVASANSSLEVRKRRLREFTPLNSEELRDWMERSKKEEIDPSTQADGEEEAPSEEVDENEPPSPHYHHTYEDFLRRFPEPHAIQQSMVVPESRPLESSVSNFAPPLIPPPSRPPPAVPRPSYGGVSDGRRAQPHVERQNSASRTALYTSNSFINRLKLPRTGLTNFGVTCYMNSTIQCLSASVMLSRFFIDNRFRYFVQKNWKGSQGVMPGLYANLIRSLWKGDVEVIMPTSFRNFCGRLNREWAIDRQQDAKEFFDFVVDCLHEDLNINWQRTPLRPLTFEEEMQRERMPVTKVSRIEWDRYRHREESYISSLFAGQHASRLRCTTCKRTSTTYEAFYSISVEIPASGTGDIYQCLRSYCQEEMLSGDEVWKCPYCKCERIATKQIIITRPPQILVIHFKRFSASKTQAARKIHTPINFPLHGLNLDRFVVHSRPHHPGDAGSPAAVPSKYMTSATTPPFTYDAYAVLRHMGSSMSSGHYVSLVRDAQRQCWRKFDDERTTDFNPRDLHFKDRLQNEQAYIVFYERAPAK